LSLELARCEAQKARLETTRATLLQELEDTKAQLQAESSAREREKEAQREADIQQSFREEKACTQVLALQSEVESLLDASRRAEHERSELERAHTLSKSKLALMSSELSSVGSQLTIKEEELKMEQSRARARERELEWEKEKECGRLERTMEEEQERVSMLQNQVEHLKRQLARESEALGKERNAAALEREKSEMERAKLKEVSLSFLSCPVLLLQSSLCECQSSLTSLHNNRRSKSRKQGGCVRRLSAKLSHSRRTTPPRSFKRRRIPWLAWKSRSLGSSSGRGFCSKREIVPSLTWKTQGPSHTLSH